MNTLINFLTAKLLKEKGFDNESAHYYNENGEMLFDVDFPSLQPTKPNVYYDNPTIAEVVMWLYEKHGIWIVASYECNIENQKREWFWTAIQDGEEIAYQYNEFNSPTEAYEAAIKYTLENLIP